MKSLTYAFNRTFIGLVLCAGATSAPTIAAEYLLVVPSPGKAAPYADIRLELSSINMPYGWVGETFTTINMSEALRITGDPEVDMQSVSWKSYAGALPPGLTLSKGGSISGEPTVPGQFSMQLMAGYKTKAAIGTYAFDIQQRPILVATAGVRSWQDGSHAQSCLAYRLPASPYKYEGATGDGLYRIAPNGQAPFDVYCDMTSDGGGWTRVVRQSEAQPVSSWAGVNGSSYALPDGQIPSHTQTAFGKDEQATFVDFVEHQYTTGDVHPAVTVTSPKSGLSYQIHRSSAYYHGYHNPEEPLYNDINVASWGNTLTIDQVEGRYLSWAFSPFFPTLEGRGAEMNGKLITDTREDYAWTVWVR